MTWQRAQEECPRCGAYGYWSTMKHEPWCPHFMRCVDESADAQLTLGEVMHDEQP